MSCTRYLLVRGVLCPYHCRDPESIFKILASCCPSSLLNHIDVLQHKAVQGAMSESHCFPAQGRNRASKLPLRKDSQYLIDRRDTTVDDLHRDVIKANTSLSMGNTGFLFWGQGLRCRGRGDRLWQQSWSWLPEFVAIRCVKCVCGESVIDDMRTCWKHWTQWCVWFSN